MNPRPDINRILFDQYIILPGDLIYDVVYFEWSVQILKS